MSQDTGLGHYYLRGISRMRPILKAAIFLLSSSSAFAQDFSGQAVVTDGDTIEMHGVRIRLWGIDAVESKQLCWDAQSRARQCGRIAANALAEFIGRRVVSCRQISRDRNRRPVAICSVDNEDIGEWLVGEGFAIDYVKYSKGAYANPQEVARKSDAGLWQMSWQYPENFRACMKTKGGNIAKCSQQ